LYPGVVAFRVNAVPTGYVPLEELSEAQSIDTLPPICRLIEWACGIIRSSRIRRIPPVEAALRRPGLILKGYAIAGNPAARRDLAAALIRDHPDRLAPHVVDSVWEKNSHNKWTDSVVLLDRQGFLFASAEPVLDTDRTSRLRRSLGLYELALVGTARARLGKPVAGRQSRDFDEAFARLVNSPEAVLRGTTASRATWKLATAEFQAQLDYVPTPPRKFPVETETVVSAVIAALIAAAILGALGLLR
jgi:hypothetical protein